ncbi:type II toxin-antitoxin system HicB family antitoxin [Gloeocapsa sp. PCC 73106]|uniref:type II toxin-antitoxin system HicB family antitoxin n=1 Tax=Gloeocapsa sp. PCC 73106 TaxID=102232 RepID=UPI0002ACCDCB|nr:type II toxin-antitoxin system HicB family antitoxin [Gloeocapsa sp. PCC 73106]ELR96365.1 hypothetical protein GLO73106DRAFT_00001570 [Gloeocapsa sp. PCC 73106]
MDFYTVVIKKSAQYWVSLCLENGLVGQGETPDQAINKLKEAIESCLDVNSYSSPITIGELHEFLI